MNEKELFKLKEQIDMAKNKVAELQGRKKLLMEELLNKYQCTSVKDAEKLVTNTATEIGQLQVKINRGLEQIQKLVDAK